MDPTYGLEPPGAEGCDHCDASRASREVAREGRQPQEVQRANAEITRHPDHESWPGKEVVR
ncbi:hypothetical protein BG418_37610 [Streptomyces sp. CBMA152]|nr:hypothetical protein [Streptomyces sp. CBMA152]